jgi:ketosteroid isomerase-like protein
MMRSRKEGPSMTRCAFPAFLLAALAACQPAGPTSGPPPDVTQDRAAIEALLARNMFALDWRNAEAYRSTFARDGVLISGTMRERGEQIGAFLREAQQGAAPLLRHSTTNVVLDIDGDTALGRAYWIAIGSDAGPKPVLHAYGYVQDEFARENGEWRIARREVFDETRDDFASAPGIPTAALRPPPVVGDGYAENRAAIRDLQARYLYAMNWFDKEAYADTFTPDGKVYMGERVEHGREQIYTVITDYRGIILGKPTGGAEGMRPPAVRHAVTNAVVDIDGDTAKSWAYWNTFQNDNLSRSAELGNYGSYEDELVKRDGRWYFTSRKIFNQMRADRVAPRELPFPARVAAGTPQAATAADDRAAIENLQARYMFALDWQDPDAYAATFAPDGVLVSAVAQAEGREAIRAEVVKMRENDVAAAQPGLFAFSRRHVITNLVLAVDGERATGRAYWIGYINDNPDRKPVLEGYGHYEDELVKVDGEWLFARRRIFNELRPGHTASAQWPLAR